MKGSDNKEDWTDKSSRKGALDDKKGFNLEKKQMHLFF